MKCPSSGKLYYFRYTLSKCNCISKNTIVSPLYLFGNILDYLCTDVIPFKIYEKDGEIGEREISHLLVYSSSAQ